MNALASKGWSNCRYRFDDVVSGSSAQTTILALFVAAASVTDKFNVNNMVTINHTLFVSNFMGKSLCTLRIVSVVPDNQLIPLKK